MSTDSRNSYSTELPNLEEVKSKGSLFAKGQGHYEVKVISIPDETKSEKSEEREKWAHSFDFILSAMGYSVGLGNIWRFPYKMHQNGQGAFLIPYFIMLLGMGIPIFFLEFVLGQYSAQGPIKVFGRLSPIFKGLGFSMLCMTCLVAIYYNVILAWTFIYMFAGFQSNLPWTSQGEVYGLTDSENYFHEEVVGLSNGTTTWSDYGTMQWKLVLSLFAAWSLVCVSTFWGMRTSGRIIYFTVLYPIFVMIILTIVGLSTFEDSGSGLREFMTPNMTTLGDYKVRVNLEIKQFCHFNSYFDDKVWQEAATQMFYSLGPGFGSLITLSSYNRFNNNILRDTLIIVVGDTLHSVLAGCMVFTFLGGIAKRKNVSVLEVVQNGPALTFVVLMEALSEIGPVPQLLSFMFTLMLLVLGLDSVIAYSETLVTALTDNSKILQKNRSK